MSNIKMTSTEILKVTLSSTVHICFEGEEEDPRQGNWQSHCDNVIMLVPTQGSSGIHVDQ